MRILATNPDTIGDMVLRQPLYRALREAGHELLLVVRESVLPLVPYVAAGAETLVLPAEVYRDDVGRHWEAFGELFEAARRWQPDVLLVAPFRWTQFDEKLSAELVGIEGLRRIGMNGRLYAGDPYSGYAPVSSMKFDVTAEVHEEQPEVEKNAALAAAVLGRPLDQIEPRLGADEASLGEAKGILGRVGLEPGGYWLACVTGTIHVPIKAWPAENWAAVLREWAGRSGRRFLMIGLPEERESAEAVRREMGERAGQAAVWMEAGGTIGQLIALASLSAGYVGHDTGPMHVAAAVGKPVLAVFGGGHRLRFFPRAVPSVSLTMGVGCAGCGWVCSFETSYCVKALPVAEVLRAAEELDGGRVFGRGERVLAPGSDLLNRMTGEAARFAQRQLREASALAHARAADGETIRGLEDRSAERGAKAIQLGLELARANDDAVALAERLRQRAAEAERLREEARQAAELAGHRGAEAASLAERLAELERRAQRRRPIRTGLNALRGRAGWVPWRQIAVDLVCGKREYTPRPPVPQMPRLTLAVRANDSVSADSNAMRRTLESAFVQGYGNLDLVACHACGDAVEGLQREFGPRGVRFECDPDGGFFAVARAFASSDARAVGWVDAGATLEPGLLLRAGEFLRDRPRAVAIYFDDTIERNGWRSPPAPTPQLDVVALLDAAQLPALTAFFRRREYNLLGPIDPTKGTAAGWDLLARLDRRYGLHCGPGHGACRDDSDKPFDDRLPMELVRAKEAFLGRFGKAGRIRCGIRHSAHVARHKLAMRSGSRSLAFPLASVAPPAGSPGEAPSAVRLSPLTHRPPGQLIFTTRDLTTASLRPHAFYYESRGDVAVAHPPVAPEDLAATHAARARGGATVIPTNVSQSPYGGYRGGRRRDRLALRLPNPYWRLHGKDPAEPAADRLLTMLAGLVRRDDATVRLLNVGCYEGEVLDRLKADTAWQVAGTETNAGAVAAARAKGHVVWEAPAHEAPCIIPDGRTFDVIFLAGILEHLDDPPAVLRRVRHLLAPGGWLVLNTPNLDSKLLDLFGPAWAYWQAPDHRTLFGRRGLVRLARATDFRLARLRTWTDPYPAAVGAATAAMGLGATIPVGATLPPDAGSTGARVAGWARLFWDWRGLGDVMYAVLQAR